MFSNIEVCPLYVVMEKDDVNKALDYCLETGALPMFTVKGEEKKELLQALKSTPQFKRAKIKEIFVCIRFRENYFV